MTKKSLENLVGKLVSDSYGFSLDKPENKSEGATRVTFQRYIRLDKSDNTVSGNTSIVTFPGLLAVTGTSNFSSLIYKMNVQFFWLLYVYAKLFLVHSS